MARQSLHRKGDRLPPAGPLRLLCGVGRHDCSSRSSALSDHGMVPPHHHLLPPRGPPLVHLLVRDGGGEGLQSLARGSRWGSLRAEYLQREAAEI